MTVMAWIFLIVFGWSALLGWLKYWKNGVTLKHLILIMIWTGIAALSAGVLFGNLNFG